jgi:hypothetical protein
MSQPTTIDPREAFLKNLKSRFYRVLDYFSLFLYIVLISVGALLADSAIVFAIERTIASAIVKYPIVKQCFDWFQIGSAFLALFGALIHALFSAWSRIQFELETMREAR